MIGSLTGTVSHIRDSAVILDTAGVGYLVALPAPELQTITIGQSLVLLTYLSVRENALDLYGFTDQLSLNLFELLITVNGVGPKAAMAVLSGTTALTLRDAIAGKNVGLLQNVPGIGKKTAEKIVLELGEKVLGIGGNADMAPSSNEAEIVTALEGLGFRARDIHRALSDNPELRNLDTDERIKRLISMLGK